MSYFHPSSPSSHSGYTSNSNSSSPNLTGGTSPTSPSYGTYKLSEEYGHLLEEPGMKKVIATKIAKLQDSLPRLSSGSLRQARADITYLRAVYDGEPEYVAQVKAGATFSAAT